MLYGHTWKEFFRDLKKEISEDNVSNGAAALAYYLTLAIFPAMLFLLSVVPYLPVADVDKAIMGLLYQVMPGNAATMFQSTIDEVTKNKKTGLLSFGALATLWAASSGTLAIMQQLNITYDVTEGRPFWKTRGTAVLLTILFGALIIAGFSLVVFGGKIQEYLSSSLGWGAGLLMAFAAVRWVIIAATLLLGFALMYYLAPDVDQKFKFVSPGSVFGVAVLVGASLLFKAYVTNFGKYEATYGSIGAVIVLMLWLYVAGLVLLLGSEINALIEHYAPHGKEKGEKVEPEQRAA